MPKPADPSVVGLANVGMIMFSLVGLFFMLLIGGVTSLVTQNTSIRIAAIMVPFVITVLACLNLWKQSRAQ